MSTLRNTTGGNSLLSFGKNRFCFPSIFLTKICSFWELRRLTLVSVSYAGSIARADALRGLTFANICFLCLHITCK